MLGHIMDEVFAERDNWETANGRTARVVYLPRRIMRRFTVLGHDQVGSLAGDIMERGPSALERLDDMDVVLTHDDQLRFE